MKEFILKWQFINLFSGKWWIPVSIFMYKPDKGEYSVKIESEIEVTHRKSFFFFFFSSLTFEPWMSFFQYKYANFSNANYNQTGNNTLKFQLINQRADFSFALFSGGLSNVCQGLFLLFLFFMNMPICIKE